MNTKNGGARIDTELMRSSGTISGPHRKTRPVTLTIGQRVMRRVVGMLWVLDAKLQSRKIVK